MNHSYRDFETSEIGQRLAAIIRRSDMLPAYRVLSRLRMPAIQAVAWDVKPVLAQIEDKKLHDFAKQYCGALVGDVMRENGFEIARDGKGREERGAVPGAGVFTKAAIWAPVRGWGDEDPVYAKGMAAAERAIQKYRNTLTELAK
jgi:hypothetical protein